ncbi:MAG: hypothetical protein EA356_17935 [Geminicoccaceae bacterium]|nr:MAG: hypothetical protein EA356_17935 [Geminicoccaceae bacterium]
MLARTITIGLITLLIVVIIAVGYTTWQMEGEMSHHAWIAIGLGIGATIALLAALLGLMFHSHKRGYDDDAGHM